MTQNGPRASRLPPPIVKPVIVDGIRYAQRAGKESIDGQVGSLLSAYDVNGQILWTIKVYENRRRPELEGDVQDSIFQSMAVEPDGRLRIVNERGDTFLVSVKTQVVTAIARPKLDDDEDALVPPARR